MSSSDIQQILLEKVAQVLGESDIQLTDYFIDLGGNSILALQISSALREESGVYIDVAQLLGEMLGNIQFRKE